MCHEAVTKTTTPVSKAATEDASPVRIVHAIAGAPAFDGCSDMETPTRCWICGLESTRAMPARRWMGAKFTDQNKCRWPGATHVCEACAWACSWVAPPGFYGPDNPKPKRGVNLRLFSHLYDAGKYIYANKANKPLILSWLRAPKAGPWFAAIADTGQKHVLPWTPMNLSGGLGGTALFEESLVSLPSTDDGWRVADDCAALLAAGATKAEVLAGDYRAETWLRCKDRVRRFEAAYSRLRGGAWFRLVVWLSQRDEALVAERLKREKEAKRGKSERGSRRKAAARDGARAAGAPGSVSEERRESDQALVADRGPHESSDSHKRERRGVGDEDARQPAVVGHHQFSLFGGSDAER